VGQLLHSSMHRGGARINPSWMHASPSYLNIPVIHNGMQQVRRYEKGGTFNTNDASGSGDDAYLQLKGSIDHLNAQLAAGIHAYTILSESEKQTSRMESIKADATMK
jgi:hypothetical protein